ncbi:alkaline phosphatase family protein [Nocardioides bruguierae]|uniref:alkaline phosphatase family protein n=1 Tax=Nocardioides bruguierae TaxID=2945102 RepID=UPI002022130A|nr:alkaline phosphatase family protein [Nocardioides bruguierae]MCL8025028.1 alkaline phosphatase family protein [Nocardioides bruguierae]
MCGTTRACTDPAHRHVRPFERGAQALRTGRRTLLTGATAAAGAAAISVAASRPASAVVPTDTRRRAYVLVIDGCRPDEITRTLTPHLWALRQGGAWWPNARSMPVMETIPNHVMMMTGVRPDRTGVPANAVYDRALGEVRDLDQESDIRVPTVIERLNARGFTTGTVLSKEYLYGVFGERATYRWEPTPTLPVTGHAPDVFTMQAALDMLEADPHLMFVNLGDIDRFGHADVTGGTLKALRTTALVDTDHQVGRFVQALKDAGTWERSLVIVLADHSMDWSDGSDHITLSPLLEADDLLAGQVAIADNGGADLLYWTGPDAQRHEAVDRMLAIARSTDGVLRAFSPARERARYRLGDEAGDVVAFCRAGRRFSDPDPWSNPIPGNHGHPATRPIPFFLSGGAGVVPSGQVSSAQASTMDVAPTVATFFGLRHGSRVYEGRARI